MTRQFYWFALLALVLSAFVDGEPPPLSKASGGPVESQIFPGSASASSTYAGNVASHVLDGDPSTRWLANGYPTQSISLDLGADHVITRVRLLVEQAPAGLTAHVLEGLIQSPSPSYRQVAHARGHTTAGTWLELTVTDPTAFRTLRIRTVESSSWVGWREIEVFGVPRTHLPVAGVTATGTYGTAIPANAVDGSAVTVWNSGGGPTQSLTLDLGSNKIVDKVRMLTE